MDNLIKEFQETNIGLILIVLGVIIGLNQFWNGFFKPMVNNLIAEYGFVGLIIVVGIIYWLLQKTK